MMLSSTISSPAALGGVSSRRARTCTPRRIITVGYKRNGQTVFERLGGKHAVEQAVDVFYNKVISDPVVNGYFKHVDMKAQRSKQYAFLAFVLGGADAWKGRDMRSVHAELAPHLEERHYQAIVTHLRATLEELGVEEELIDEALGVVSSVHDEVLDL